MNALNSTGSQIHLYSFCPAMWAVAPARCLSLQVPGLVGLQPGLQRRWRAAGSAFDSSAGPFVALLLGGLLGGAALAANLQSPNAIASWPGSFFNRAESCWDQTRPGLQCAGGTSARALGHRPDMLLAHVLLGRVLLAGGNAGQGRGGGGAFIRSSSIDPGELAPHAGQAQLLSEAPCAADRRAAWTPRYAAGVQRQPRVRARAHLEMGASDSAPGPAGACARPGRSPRTCAGRGCRSRLQLGQLRRPMALAELALRRRAPIRRGALCTRPGATSPAGPKAAGPSTSAGR